MCEVQIQLKGACMIEQDDEVIKPPFGAWLLTQHNRGDWVDGIANAARADRSFPKNGDSEEVRAHLRKQQADGDAFVALDDAESDWIGI
jgi:hypothetical protein